MDELHLTTTSLTKGCFLFKPDEAVPKKKKKTVKERKSAIVDYYPKFTKESKVEKEQRYSTYINCWNDLETQIKEVQHNLNSKIFDDLLEFVQSTYTYDERRNFPIAEIPTAALVTGVNLPDHGVIFSQFVTTLKSTSTQYIVRLHSKDCTNLKSILRNTFDGFVKSLSEEEVTFYDEDDVDLNQSKCKKSKSLFKDYSFTELKEWYNKTLMMVSDVMEVDTRNNDCYGDENETKNNRPPLVIMLEDFERFSPSVLQDFVLIASEYISELPLVFIFGIATSVSAVHKFLPHFVSSRLSIEKFQSQPSLVCLTEVIDKVLLSNKLAFKLGPHVFRLLYEHFLYHDFSIHNFVKALKFAVLDHFSESEFSLLCTFDKNEIEKFIQSLPAQRIKLFKEIPSFFQYYDKQSEKEQKKLDNNQKYLQELLIQLIEDLQHQEKVFFPLVKCFHVLTAKLPGHPLGKRLRDTYEYSTISSKIVSDLKYKHALTLVRMLSRDELLPILNACQEILLVASVETCECEIFEEVVEQITHFLNVFEELENGTFPDEVEDTLDQPLTPNTPSTPKTPTVFKSRHEFREKMKSAVKEKRKESPYEKLRNEIVDMFDSLFKKYMHSPLSMALHEIFYYNDSYTLKQRIDGTPRVAIQAALSNPKSYLKCGCCPAATDIIQDTLPDVCILYKLHLECAKLINLYDWLQAFITVIDPSLVDSKRKKSKAKQKLEEQLQARFIRGVSELQYLGFIKGTKRKTDHVQRLTWGGC